MTSNKQILLRVKRGGQLDNVLRPMVDGQGLIENEIQDLAGLRKMPRLLRAMATRWFDNIAINDNGSGELYLTYTDITPKRPQAITVQQASIDAGKTTVKSATTDATDATVTDYADIPTLWPDPPMQDETLDDRYVKPDWHDEVGMMIKFGKHISVESGPGVGKDTTIMELAIQHGKPLVTLGGDGGFRRKELIGSQELVNGRSCFKVAEYAAAVVNGWWCSISEINAAEADAILAMNNQLARPYSITINGQNYPVHPEFRLFITYNAGLTGTKPLPESFKDRFATFKLGSLGKAKLRAYLEADGMPAKPTDNYGQIQVTVNGETSLLGEMGMSAKHDWTDDLIDFYMAMQQAKDEGRMRYQITTRKLMDAKDWMMAYTLWMDGDKGVRTALRKSVLSAIDNVNDARTTSQIIKGINNG